MYYTWKNPKHHIKTINLEYQLQHEMKNVNYLIYNQIVYIRYSKSFWIYIKNHGEKTVNPPIRIYVNKIENRITFKIKTGYYLEFLTPETMELCGSTKSNITKMKIVKMYLKLLIMIVSKFESLLYICVK